MDDRAPVLILGGGIAGLAAAQALSRAGEDFTVVEAEDRVGGLCRTETVNGFAFDRTGHLLHLREGRVRDFVLGLMGGRLTEHARRASVRVEGTYAPYPIQANFGRLPSPWPDRCLADYSRARPEADGEDLDFEAWTRARFGDSLADLFMVPYNRKLFVYPLGEMEPSWTSWSVPRPTAEQMVRAARGEDTGSFGYNVTFHYPAHGGIEALPRALAAGLGEGLRTGVRVRSVRAGRREAVLTGGEVLRYRALISTAPLPELARMIEDAPPGLAPAAARLRHSSVLGVCMGLDRPLGREEHWIYYPEARFPFYRVGFPSNVSRALVPSGGSSLCAEVAHEPGRVPPSEALMEGVEALLREEGVIPRGARVVTRLAIPIPFAYVFFDRFRKERLPGILAALKGLGIRSVGRYGAWEYSAMQDAIGEGLAAAGEALA